MTTGTGVVIAKYLGDAITFDGTTVTITRGVFSGHGRGTNRTIPVSRITGVEIQRPGLRGSGALTIHVPGASEARKRLGSGNRDNLRNENTVMIGTRRHLPAFEAVRDAILNAL